MANKVDTDTNESAFAKWKAAVASSIHGRFVGIVDGDNVEEGNDFPTVAINTSQLAAQRGKGAKVDVYDSLTEIATPH